jgi:polyisoprenyl-teichoic acid--peptidoglycan teichoic acid transferase
MLKKLIPIAFLVLATLACSLPINIAPAPTPEAVSQLIVTMDPNAPPTSTPFQPAPRTATPTRTPMATATQAPPTKTATKAPPTATAFLPGVNPIANRTNILVLGSDKRKTSDFRTDVMVLISINPSAGTVSMVSFPRDLYVKIPGYGTDRINTAMERGGFKMMADTFETNFGVRPSAYVLADFAGFVKIINSLGGIDVKVGLALRDKCDLPQGKGGYCSVTPGVTHMDGATALWYVRSRYSSSDFYRGQRAQEVLMGIFQRALSLNTLVKAPELYNTYKTSFETNLGLLDMLPLIKVAPQMSDSSRIKRYAVGPEYVSNYTTSSGAMVLLPNLPKIKEMIRQALSQ